ncbi:MAG: chromosomal replication initiator protein DnaA [Eubacterium sp.]|nr:chromosomal replication initiator protein DnaA [Eubacterium sp.]MDE6156047.1 chromosomal replication initiator protein DnaA [Eubacterium sp.]
MNSFNDIWQAVLDVLKTKVSDTAYTLWFKPVEFDGFNNSTVTLRFPSAMYLNIVPSQFGNHFEDAFESVLGFKVNISYICDETENTKNFDNNDTTYQDKHLEDYKNEQFTFENFIVGPSNRFVYAAAKAVASDPGSRLSANDYNPLFIYGNSGLGKTHILNAICHEVEKNFPDMKIMYVRAEQFANEFYQALQNKTIDEFHSKYRNNIDVFLIDDIQFISGKTSTEEEFFHTFDTLVYGGKQVVLTSDRPPRDIQSLTDRLKSRFEDGLLADIQPPEPETKREIIKRKAKLLNFEISDHVVEYIADKVKSNIRQLEGVTKKLYVLCNLNNYKPTIALAQSVIKDIMEETQPLPVTIQKIVEEVSRTTGISVEDIYSKVQKANISHARKITFYVIRKVTDMSYEEIGKEFKKHHSTVIYNIDQIEQEMQKNSKLARQINDIINNVKVE